MRIKRVGLKANIIDGKSIAQGIKSILSLRVDRLKAEGVFPKLAVILVGSDPASLLYVANKERACKEIGVESKVIRLAESIGQEELLKVVDALNADETVHGVLVQLPLPPHIDAYTAINRVSIAKDVDGLHVQNFGQLFTGKCGVMPCTAKGIIAMIESTGMPIEGKLAVVIGRSNIVGKPVAALLQQKNATVTVCHTKTQNLAGICLAADILVVAAGVPGLVGAEMIKEGAVVIDVGTTKTDSGLKGDVKFDEAIFKASYISPVPGGVGPMTIAMLLENTIESAEKHV